jgi:uncharacterized membrane protein
MHFLNRVGALILFVCVAWISHVATLYDIYRITPAGIIWAICLILVLIGLYMWLKDWYDYFMLSFKWYDKWK